VVPQLKGTPLRAAKHLLGVLGCKSGKVGHRHSKSIRKGSVIGTTPGAGTYAGGKVVRIEVSAGRKKTKKGRGR
jgi:beta-lactam-binding protein with PASTA domain